jgi:alkylation response protein AidB-like acyl-CoA dehydrogenase
VTDLVIDRQELRDVARRLLDAAGTIAAVRAAGGTTDVRSPVWSKIVAAGWTGIAIPEEFGGAGASFSELAVVLIELGRALAPGPYLGTAVLGPSGLLFGGTAEQREYWLPRLAAGESVATAALTGASGRLGAAEARPVLTPEAGGWRLDGVAAYVPDLPGADVVIVAANLQGEPALVLISPRDHGDLVVEPTPLFDLSRCAGRLQARDVALPPAALMARGDDAGRAIAATIAWGATALACDSLGVAEHVLEATVAYAGQRVQFNRPIGTFQVVKHRCADMFLAVQSSRVAVEEAARQVGSDVYEAGPAASLAKAHAGDAAAQVAGDGVQLHGGIGFTWEHDSHLYLKRAKLNQALLGSSRWHRRRLADHWLPTETRPGF